jgi:hypothetical protein
MLKKCSYSWPYNHERWEEEAFTKNAQSWDEVLERRSNPHITIFKTMSLDEQMLEINHGVATNKVVDKQRI